MNFLWMKISEWLKELLVAGIIGNLSGLFDGINDKVAQITDVVGMTPQQWNGGVFSMVKTFRNRRHADCGHHPDGGGVHRAAEHDDRAEQHARLRFVRSV